VNRAFARVSLLAVTMLAGCAPGDQSDDVRVGDVIALKDHAVRGPGHFFQLPDRQLTFRIDPDLGDVTGELALDRDAHRTPDGQRFVGIEWDSESGAGIPGWLSTVLMGDGGPPDPDSIAATLVVGKERVPVGSPAPFPDAVVEPDANTLPAFAVAVPETGDVSLEVTFSGQTQSFDVASGEREAGEAEPLYHLPADEPVAKDCVKNWSATATPANPRTQAAVAALKPTACRWTLTRLPYVAQGGWAESPDQPWLLLVTGIRVGDLETPSSRYSITEQSDETTVDGAEPTWRVLDQGNDGAWSTISVYAGSSGPIELSSRVSYRLEQGEGPSTMQVLAGTSLR